MAHPPYHQPPSMSGFLVKASALSALRTKYFFRLDACTLSRFRYQTSKKPAWVANIAGAHVQPVGKNGIAIVFQHARHTLLYAKNAHHFASWFQSLTNAATYTLQNYYHVANVIAVGGFASVRCATEKATATPVAVKTIQKHNSTPTFMQTELAVLRSVHHPRLVRTYHIFETHLEYHIVMELMHGGMLFDEINRRTRFSEPDTRHIIAQLLTAVAYLHSVGVVHRDLKPENILLTSRRTLDLKLADFGLSSILSASDTVMTTLLGTPQFIAPEVVRAAHYDERVDVWAVGIIMYNLLTGTLPFTEKQVFEKYRQPHLTVPFRKTNWKLISPLARSLTRQMLCTHPSKRLSAAAALHHRWFTTTSPATAAAAADAAVTSPSARCRVAVHCVRFLLRLASESGQLSALNFHYMSLRNPHTLVALDSSECSLTTSLANSDWDFELATNFGPDGVESVDNWGNTHRNPSNNTHHTPEQSQQQFLARMARGLALLQTTNEQAPAHSTNAQPNTNSNHRCTAAAHNLDTPVQLERQQKLSDQHLHAITTSALTNCVADVSSVRSLPFNTTLTNTPDSIPTTPVTYNFDSSAAMRNLALTNDTSPNSTTVKGRHGARLKHWLHKAFRPLHHIHTEIATRHVDQS